MQVVFKQLAILYIFLLAGWLIGKWKKEKAAHADILSVLIVNIFLPCKVFSTFANNVTVDYLSEKYELLLVAILVLLILITVGYFLSKLLTKDAYERRVFRYSIPIANYAYLGYTLIGSVFGERVLADFMLFAVPFVFYTYTVGYILLTGSGNPLKKLINPMTAAIILGISFGLLGIRLPDLLSSVVSMASACVGPMTMILTGITLSTFAAKELLGDKKAYFFSFLRLVGFPAVAYFICRIAHLDAFLPMILIVTCMPCGLNTIVFPKLVGEDCTLGARLALITHVLSMITLPLWLSILL